MKKPSHARLVLIATLALVAGLPAAARAVTRGCIQSPTGVPLARVWLSWTQRGIPRSAMTDVNGCATVSAPRAADGRAEVVVHAHNPVVRVLDGGIFNFEVVQPARFRDGETVRIAAQGEFWRAAEEFRVAYERGLREFSPWDDQESPNATSRTSDEYIEVSVHDGSPAAVSWTEPKAIGSDFPLIHLKDRRRTTTSAHELGHALHFSRLSVAMRQEIGDEYLAWLLSHLNDPFHCTAKRTTPFVAYIEAFGLFAEKFASTGGIVEPVRHNRFYADARRFLAGADDTNCDGVADGFHPVQGDDVEGAVFGVIFVEFASDPAVGLDYAVSRYVDCGSLDLQEYALCVFDREGADSPIAQALVDAGHEFGVDFDVHDPWPSLPTAGDDLGQVLAAGDFDGDGDTDLAVGAPHDAPDGETRTGAVYVFKGSATGLHRWLRLLPSPGYVLSAGDEFGAALAAGDFDDDGLDDLAVGAPGVDHRRAPNAGTVFVFPGGRTRFGKPMGYQQILLGGVNGSGDRLGAALAAGDLDGDGIADLAAGAPGKRPAASPAASGLVYALRGGDSKLEAWAEIDQIALDGRESGDEFGASLAIGNFDANGADEIAIGAPGNHAGPPRCRVEKESDASSSKFKFAGKTPRFRTVCTPAPAPGAVFVFSLAAGAPAPMTLLREEAFGGKGGDGDRFGAALAAGRIAPGAGDALAVGAPNARPILRVRQGAFVRAAPRSGHVFVFEPSDAGLEPWDHFHQGRTGGSNRRGDRFGAALAIGRLDGDGPADLAVGAPGDAVARRGRSGTVHLLSGGAARLEPWDVLDQNPFTAVGAGHADQPGDHFGASLAVGNFDGDGGPDLAVGAPDDAYQRDRARGGMVYALGGTGSELLDPLGHHGE